MTAANQATIDRFITEFRAVESVSYVERDILRRQAERPNFNKAERANALAEQYADRSTADGSDVDKDLLDAKLEASEARTETKFAQLVGTLGELRVLIESKPSKWDMWGGMLALFVAILGILAFGSDRLALGVGLADTRQEQLERDRSQDVTAKEMNAKLDRLLAEKEKPGEVSRRAR